MKKHDMKSIFAKSLGKKNLKLRKRVKVKGYFKNRSLNTKINITRQTIFTVEPIITLYKSLIIIR